jgi:hypothetical protein
MIKKKKTMNVKKGNPRIKISKKPNPRINKIILPMMYIANTLIKSFINSLSASPFMYLYLSAIVLRPFLFQFKNYSFSSLAASVDAE